MNKTVIYTAIFGNKDNLTEPEYLPKDCDFICFTDADFKSDVWQIKKVEPPFSDSVRCARFYKILAHRFLPQYEYSIWVDGNMRIRGDVNKLIKKSLKDVNLAVYDHQKTKADPRSCLYQEAEVLLQMHRQDKGKDNPKIIEEQVKRYQQLNYPKNNGLASTMVMIRRHNQPDVAAAMENWWSELEKYSRRDQLSFNFIAWQDQLKFRYLKGDSRKNRYFLWTEHFLKKSPTFSKKK